MDEFIDWADVMGISDLLEEVEVFVDNEDSSASAIAEDN